MVYCEVVQGGIFFNHTMFWWFEQLCKLVEKKIFILRIYKLGDESTFIFFEGGEESLIRLSSLSPFAPQLSNLAGNRLN